MHLTREALEAGLEGIRRAPADAGRLALIVRRSEVDAREVLDVTRDHGFRPLKPSRPMVRVRSGLAALTALASTVGMAGQGPDRPRPEETEVWRPVPPVIDPGPAPEALPPPSDAIVLFDGTGLDEWVGVRDGGPAGWTVHDGVVTVDKAAGNIETRRRFRHYQLHLEWRVPAGTTGSGQSRGNSGLFLASTGPGDAGYELQILDSYENETYVNGMAGSVYKQSPPLANPARPPGAWQSYDVVWTAPDFDPGGTLRAPARVTALFNGVLVQRDFALAGETVFAGAPRYRAHGDAPIKLQAHGDPSPPISFRNIWVRVLP